MTRTNVVSVVVALTVVAVGATAEEPAVDLPSVIDFSTVTEPWPSIDDAVMGGVSSSRMRIENGAAVFEGTVSLENNGGFASVRSHPERHDLSRFRGVVLVVRGDGHRYRFRLRTTDAFDGVSYEAAFDTQASRRQRIELPFDVFEPRFRGRPVPGHPRLDPAEIRTFGLLISDRQEGPFRLELERVDGLPAKPQNR